MTISLLYYMCFVLHALQKCESNVRSAGIKGMEVEYVIKILQKKEHLSAMEERSLFLSHVCTCSGDQSSKSGVCVVASAWGLGMLPELAASRPTVNKYDSISLTLFCLFSTTKFSYSLRLKAVDAPWCQVHELDWEVEHPVGRHCWGQRWLVTQQWLTSSLPVRNRLEEAGWWCHVRIAKRTQPLPISVEHVTTNIEAEVIID